ncbi:MAG TPA: flagellar basal body L-ring protein FlgH [Acetobacteraceae bacterium]|nr:flagellar basal body L-ring protein FlgH [Acetobacteraceae bacterium]
MMRRILPIAPFALALLLPGCGVLSQLSEIGHPPAMSPITNPTSGPKWRPVSMPMPAPRTAPPQADSLWRPGSRAFFQDQRASHVGDIVTILVDISDNATLKNASSATRAGGESLGVPNLFGLEAQLPNLLTKAVDPKSLLSANSTGNYAGAGQIQRNETVTLSLAGVITQVLPNGNLVVSASQEMRVNSELRVLTVNGVIRPQDISSENTVKSERLAEARISYGGRGQLTTVQTPRVGQQVLDTLLPF